MIRFPGSRHALSAGELTRRSVLLAGGERDWRDTLKAELIACGASFFAVDSPLEALASAAGRQFDAIIVPIENKTDALEAARRIRAIPSGPLGPALVAILKDEFPNAAHWAAESGFDGFLYRRNAALQAPRLLSLLLKQSLVETAELDQIQQENHGDEPADGEKSDHDASPEIKSSSAI